MAETKSRFFSLMVVGNNPQNIIEKYSRSFKTEPYVKYKYLDAKKYQDAAIKSIKAILDNADTCGLTPNVKEALQHRIKALSSLTPFEYYRELTDGMYYDDNGNALSEENPNAKYVTCRIGRNFCLPLKLKNGSESYSAHVEDVDWNQMHKTNQEIYMAAWEMVMEGRKPQTDEEKAIYTSMKDKTAYFGKFDSKDDYVSYSTSYWNYAYADDKGWIDVDDNGDEKKWIDEFYERFISQLKPNDLITIYECSINNG